MNTHVPESLVRAPERPKHTTHHSHRCPSRRPFGYSRVTLPSRRIK